LLEHRHAEVNGIRLHYVTCGQGPLVLFLHGFPEFWYAWKDLLADFGRDHQAVAVDMRGYNESSRPAAVEQYRIEHLVEDVRALADHLGRERFVLVAHDWGGGVAWAFAIRHPERLDGLVVINAPHPAIFQRELRENPAQQQASRYMLVFRSPDAEAILAADGHAALVKAVLAEGLARGYFTEADRRAYVEAWSRPGTLTGGLNYYRAARLGPPGGEDAPARGNFGLAEPSLVVRVPTLVVWGEQDRALLPGNLEGLEAFVPDLTVRRVPDGTHWVVHEHPDLVIRYIREFIGARR
jgi:pimeloyl-ACP methyl ester carboxylesterase